MLCTLDRKIYEDRDSGFSIASFKTKDEAVPSAARSTYYHGDRMIRFTAVGYHLPTTSVIVGTAGCTGDSFILGFE